jgi:DNA-dependent RNA polymerase auxiliary subunit epsilon
MKKILFGVFLSLIFALFVFAQNENNTMPGDFGSNSLYVGNIVVNEESFVPGSKVDGTFEINNVTDYVISGIKYRVEFIQMIEDTITYDYGDGGPVEELKFDQITVPFAFSSFSNPISVSPGVSVVNFNYQIPDKIPEGRVGLKIQLYTDNNLASDFGYEELNISGPRISYLFADASILIKGNNQENNQIFSPLEGPTVSKNDAVSLVVLILNNSSSETFNLVPEMKIFSGNNFRS